LQRQQKEVRELCACGHLDEELDEEVEEMGQSLMRSHSEKLEEMGQSLMRSHSKQLHIRQSQSKKLEEMVQSLMSSQLSGQDSKKLLVAA
jgi:hypothetical protein